MRSLEFLSKLVPRVAKSPATNTTFSRKDRQFIQRVRAVTASLDRETDQQLRSRTEDLRAASVYSAQPNETTVVQGFGLVLSAIKRTLNWEIYDVQLLGAHRLTQHVIAEMQTGEGKTITSAPAAFVLGLSGRGVHITTPNAYLAQRDHEQLAPVFELLGFTVGLVPERVSAEAKRSAYQCDIIYGTGYEFGFDYLRDQIAAQPHRGEPLGREFLSAFRGQPSRASPRAQRRLAYALVDEADHVLLDDATSPLIISGATLPEAPDQALHRKAVQLVSQLELNQDYVLVEPSGQPRFTAAGLDRIYSSEFEVSFHELQRPWNEYVLNALQAHFCFFRDVHYIIREGNVEIIDPASGRIFADRTWRDGLHQAIQAKEQVKITAEQVELAQITRQRFYRLYDHVCGMTGTVTGCARELQHVYRLGVRTIPRRFPSRRTILPLRVFAKREQKYAAIAADVLKRTCAGQPVLVGTNSIVESHNLASLFEEFKIPHQLLNGRQDATEAEIIGRAGRYGCVTIATNMAGRGTDIRIDPAAAAAGGLHVIVSECHPCVRVDQQLVGRSARQNDPGSAQKFACAEDPLFTQYAGWLGSLVHKYLDRRGEITIDLTAQLQRAQQIAERTHYLVRCQMLRRDLARESLLNSLH